MQSGVFDKTNHGECSQCGACCSNALPMSKEEIGKIRKYIKENNIKEYKRVFPLKNPTINMTCPFMDDSKQKEKCRIYPVRPEICRQFICCPEKRKLFDFSKVNRSEIVMVNVREEFFYADN